MPQIFKLPSGELREYLERVILLTARSAGMHWPLPKGKYRMMLLAESLCRNFPKEVRVSTPDGRILELSFSPNIWDTVFFFGEYEPEITNIVGRIIENGDCCLDVGANFGWYTTLFSKLVGPDGSVFSFEPHPETFELLRKNVSLLELENFLIYNFGLGRYNGEAELHLFDELGSGHSSIADHGRADTKKIKIEMRTFDDFAREHSIKNEITFLKADIEGAELDFLAGAESLFQQAVPPIILMEMALEQASAFGYSPNDLIEFIRQRRPYRFFAIDMFNGRMTELQNFPDGHIGANVIAFPEGFYNERLARLSNRIC